jgi:hypothetical protein
LSRTSEASVGYLLVFNIRKPCLPWLAVRAFAMSSDGRWNELPDGTRYIRGWQNGNRVCCTIGDCWI